MRMSNFKKLVLFMAVPLMASCAGNGETNSSEKALFNGEDLTGWTQKGGEASYRVEDGVIIGETRSNTPNSFLTTDKLYDDFIMELEYKVDPSMNSGIQIRSNSKPDYQNARVHGYQIEIDPSKRAWSGGIYDEARRGWLVSLENNQNGQQAFKQNEWNHVRVEAIGDTIKAWLNNVPTAFLIDDLTGEGFIALQVHSIGNEEEPGKQIMWKNITIQTDSLSQNLRPMDLQPVNTRNSLTKSERESGWELLWDGETTTGWKGARLDHFPEQGWVIEDGILTVLASGGQESAAGGDIVTHKDYKDFEMKVDFKLTKAGNSGIKYYVDTDINQGPGSSIGLEYQILDDEYHPDAKLGNHPGSRTVASLYDLIQADPDKPINEVGSWNTAHIISKDNHVEHWLNGKKVLEFERGSENFRKLVSESKYDQWPNFGELEKGRILLQDHGDKVSFKNIKIREL